MSLEFSDTTVKGTVTLDDVVYGSATVTFVHDLDGRRRTTQTDENGEYSLSLDLVGGWKSHVSSIEGACESESVQIDRDDTITIDYDCDPFAGAWRAAYAILEQTCVPSGVEDFEVEATATARVLGEDTEVSFSFEDGPEAMVGTYDAETGEVKATTPLVGIGNSLKARESWDAVVEYRKDPLLFELRGISIVDVLDESGRVCYQNSDLTLAKLSIPFP